MKAPSQPHMRTCIPLLGLLWIQFLTVHPPVIAADTEIIIRASDVNQAFNGAAANYDTYAQLRAEDLAYLKYVIELYRDPVFPASTGSMERLTFSVTLPLP